MRALVDSDLVRSRITAFSQRGLHMRVCKSCESELPGSESLGFVARPSRELFESANLSEAIQRGEESV